MIVAILSSARSGSRWLCSLFRHPNNISLDEWFNLYHYPTLRKITIKQCYAELQEKIAQSRQHNKDLYVKVTHNQYLRHPKIVNNFLDQTDLLVRLYRENKLLQYISLEKARKTSSWWRQHKKVDKDQVKIVWNVKKYESFHQRATAAHHWINNHLSHKPSVLFTYETIHHFATEPEKLNYVREQIQKAGFELSYNENVNTYGKKENNITNLADHFVNPNDFLGWFLKM